MRPVFDGLGRADPARPIRLICRGWARPGRWGRRGQGTGQLRLGTPVPGSASSDGPTLDAASPDALPDSADGWEAPAPWSGGGTWLWSGRPSGDRSHSGTTGHPAASAARRPRARSGRRTRHRLPTPRREADPVQRRDPHRRRRGGCVGPDPSPRSRPPRSPQRWSAAPWP